MADLPSIGGSDVWGAQLNQAIAGLLTPTAPDYDFPGTSFPGGLTLGGSYVSGDMTVHDGFLEVSNGRAAGSYIYAADPGGDLTVTMRAATHKPPSTGSPAMFGLMAMNNSGTGIGLGWYGDNSTNSDLIGTLASAAYTTLVVQGTQFEGRTLRQGMWVWYRMRRVGTTYYLSMSLNGDAWSAEISGTNGTSMTRLAFGSFFGTVPGFLVDYFDIT